MVTDDINGDDNDYDDTDATINVFNHQGTVPNQISYNSAAETTHLPYVTTRSSELANKSDTPQPRRLYRQQHAQNRLNSHRPSESGTASVRICHPAVHLSDLSVKIQTERGPIYGTLAY